MSDAAGSRITEVDRRFAELAFEQAKKSYAEGGLPIGAVVARKDTLIGFGHNQRIQHSDPVAHGEMDCLRHAGRQKSYRDVTLYTTLSPCMMCSGTIVQFKIPRLIINDVKNFGGNEAFLRQHGVEVIDIAHEASIALMARFIAENPDIWNEDIME
jgi:cytosine deaminase